MRQNIRSRNDPAARRPYLTRWIYTLKRAKMMLVMTPFMQVFVDESGDAGLKLTQGSTPFFVIALVAFSDPEAVNLIDQRLTLLRKELHVSEHFEFKFSKCRSDLRKAFLQSVAPCDFFYYGIVIDKSGLTGAGFKVKESFYKYVIQLLFLNAREHLDEAVVHIDASGEREFRRQLDAYIKRRINTEKSHVRHVRFLNSANSNLIQLADMVAGAIHRSQTSKPDAQEYISLIRHREAYVQVWPRREKKKPKS